VEELHALLGVHRAVDEAVEADPERLAAVATLFPTYGADAIGWSTAFARMLVEHGNASSPEEVFPPLTDALENLAEVPPRHPWQGVRRLHALTALTRVSPDHAPDGSQAHLVAAALDHLTHPDSSGGRLHALLVDHANLTHVTWAESLRSLVVEGIVAPTYYAMSTAPCTGELIGVEIEGDVDPVTVLTTHFSRGDLTVADLDLVLDAASWPSCPGFWCAMTEELPAPDEDTRRFIEVVASDCDGAWKITTRLDFVRRRFRDGSASLDYWLSPDQWDPADGLVVVDEGSILVEPAGAPDAPGVCVTTTKRIRFVDPLSGAQLAMTACALGWDGAGEQFVFGCGQPPPPYDPDHPDDPSGPDG
jgi:hypothetical protein